MTENYEFNRSMHMQTEDQYSPYYDKQANNYINDINSGVYQNSGLSLVQTHIQYVMVSDKRQQLRAKVEYYRVKWH